MDDVKNVATIVADFIFKKVYNSDEPYYSELFKLYGFDEKLSEKQLMEAVCLKVVCLREAANRLIASSELRDWFCDLVNAGVALHLARRYSDLKVTEALETLRDRVLLYDRALSGDETDELDKESGATAVFIVLFMPEVGSRAQQEEMLRVGTLAVAILETEQKSAEMTLEELIKKEHQKSI